MATITTLPIEVEINSPVNITSEITTNLTLEAAVYNGARGRSAYEVWIGEGYTGSEEDFLQWLRVQTAAETTVVDIGNHYQATNVEDILQEVAQMIAATTDKHYKHTQGIASSTWVIQHNLNKYPAVYVFDNYARQIIGDIVFNDANKLTIKFSGGFSGVAYLN